MLIAIAVFFAILWLFGFFVYHVATGAIHLLLVVAVVALVAHLLRYYRGGRGRPLAPSA